MSEGDVPQGFKRLETTSPFNLNVGPYYVRIDDGRLILGLRVASKHCNSGGRLHGSMICAMADIAIGHNVGLVMGQQKLGDNIDSIRGMPKAALATVSLNTDFVGAAGEGDWVEVHVDVQKVGRTLAFANAYVTRDDERIARTSAVFRILNSGSP